MERCQSRRSWCSVRRGRLRIALSWLGILGCTGFPSGPIWNFPCAPVITELMEGPLDPREGWIGWGAVEVVAHRGFACCFSENTIPALDGAFRLGSMAAEVDVRMTRDEIPVLMHDDDIRRTTDGHGRVAELRFSTLSSVNACSRKGGRCVVPSLARALSFARGKGRLVLDLKGGMTCSVVGAILDEVRENGMIDEVAVISGSPLALANVRTLAPTVPIGLYSNSLPAFEAVWDLGLFEAVLTSSQLDESDGVAHALRAREVPIIIFTAQTPGEVAALLGRSGVARVLSDVVYPVPVPPLENWTGTLLGDKGIFHAAAQIVSGERPQK